MAPKKQAKKTTKKKNVSGEKRLGLFDHVKAVKSSQDPKYFDKISDDDKKSWSSWMILRALSMNDEYLPVVNELQVYMNLPAHLMYRLLIDVFPKSYGFDKFIRGKGETKYEGWLVDLIKKDSAVSTREAIGYLDIFMLTNEGKESILELCQRYGKDPKEIKKLKL